MITRIYALILQEIYITKRSLEVLIDSLWFSALNVILFGYIAQFLAASQIQITGSFLIMGVLFWEVIRINQYSLTLHPLWNIWSRNLSNLFITPLSKEEYILSQIIAAFIKSAFIFLINASIAALLFQYNIFSLGAGNVLFYLINFSLFSWSVGMVIIGLIFMYGTRIQALAWGSIFLFQPLMAVFFPVSILPANLQRVAYLFPPTYFFEAIRGQMAGFQPSSLYLHSAMLLNILYFLLSLALFNFMFKKSQEKGQFAKNDEQ